ncbi:MAG: N-acetylmuramoyl-L-alanine amidase CwlD [Clostridia bacterium]|nr:N-acetylmuramoyl-L-alanine amidase CwlD [Clostridia bacterium]
MLKKNIAMYSVLAVLLIISIVSAQRITYTSVPVNVATPSKSRLPVIVIDAGHGGVDGGSVGMDGTLEKEINLKIALKLRDTLELYGYETVMIREEDKSIHNADANTIREKKVSDLHNRLNIINSTDNCVYISIHQNYFEQSKYSGTQVFYSPNNEESEMLAQIMQQTIVETLQNDNTRQIKCADKTLYLLYNSNKPSVMIECGFLSNVNELSLLKTDEYQQQMALCIANGILKYTEKINSGE